MIHMFQQNIVSLQLPIYIEAVDLEDAISKASVIKGLISHQFELLFEPSDPVLLSQAINNGPSFGTFFSALGNGNKVTLNLPANFNITLYQPHLNKVVSSIEARVLIGGANPTIYSLLPYVK